jgi:hypothetical protein
MDSERANLAGLTDDELGQRLFDLGEHLAWPATPELDWRAAEQAPVRLRVRRGLWVAAAIVLIALGAALALSQGFRDTVAGVFSVRGIDIVLLREDDQEPSNDVDALSRIAIGEPVALDEARAAVPFEIWLPATTGEPAGLFLRALPGDDRMVTAVYEPGPEIPETAETGVGILIMQFTTRNPTPSLIKGLLSDDVALAKVDVNGADGYWIAGVTQLTILEDPSIAWDELTSRPSGNVLIWQENGVAYRMESALSMHAALEIARSMQPVDE